MSLDEVEEQSNTPRWLIGAQLVTAVLTFVGTFWLSLAGKAAAPFAIAGVGLLLLFRFGDIASLTLEGLGGRAEMRRETRRASKVTREAERTIETLKQTGLLLSAHTLNLMALQGQEITATIPELISARDDVVSNLRAMGCEEDQIEKLMVPFRGNTFTNMLFLVLDDAAPDDLTHVQIREELYKLPTDFSFDAMSAAFAKYNALNSDVERRLREIARFYKDDQIDFEKFDLK